MQKRLFGLLASVVMIVTACGGTTTSNPPASAGGSQAPGASAESAAPASADLRFAIGGEPTYFSNSANDDNTAYVYTLIYDAVLGINNKGELYPTLAAAMPSASADGKTVTVKLRNDVKW